MAFSHVKHVYLIIDCADLPQVQGTGLQTSQHFVVLCGQKCKNRLQLVFSGIFVSGAFEPNKTSL